MRRPRLWILLALLSLGLLLAARPPHPAAADNPDGLYTVRERFGVGLVTAHPADPGFPGRLADYAGAETLGFGWYADWSMRANPERPAGIEYAQMLSLEPWREGQPTAAHLATLREVADANPGALWIVGNEPDHLGQGNCTPGEYAGIYHRAYTFLKSADPTAQVAIGGIVMPSPIRLMWLERTLDAYRAAYGHLPGHDPMPVDVWNTHVQLLRENWWDGEVTYTGRCCDGGAWGALAPVGLDPADPDVRAAALQLTSCDNTNGTLFAQQIRDLRQFLVDHGQGDKPLIISEYGVLMPDVLLSGGERDVLRLMHDTFTFLLTATDPVLGYSEDGGRLVQRWLWFSLNTPLPTWVPDPVDPRKGSWEGFNGSLYDYAEPTALTPFGELFRDYVAAASSSSVLPTPFPTLEPDRPVSLHVPMVVRR